MGSRFIKKVGAKLLSKNLQLEIRKRLSARRFKSGKYTKEPEMEILKYFVQEGAAVLDIGANLGNYTYAFVGKVGKTGRVLSFEPIPEAYERLLYASRKLGWFNARLFNVALGSEDGQFQMNVPVDENGREILGLSHLADEGDRSDFTSYTVEVRRLDGMKLDLEGLAFIKCDVEGAELKVLKGAEQTIREHRPVMMVEIENRHLERYHLTSRDVFNYLNDIKYDSYYYNGERLIKCFDCIEGYANYFFIPKESPKNSEV